MARIDIDGAGEAYDANISVTFWDFPYPSYPGDIQITCDSDSEPGRQIKLTLLPEEALQFCADLMSRLAERTQAAPHLIYPSSPPGPKQPLPR